jgi:hypothetical protein
MGEWRLHLVELLEQPTTFAEVRSAMMPPLLGRVGQVMEESPGVRR